jgi:hypothetical protein
MAAPTAAFGAGTGLQVRPPSAVRSIAAQRVEPHGTLPRTHPSLEETNVTETGSKPTGVDADEGLEGDGLTSGTLGDGTAEEGAPGDGIPVDRALAEGTTAIEEEPGPTGA